MRGLQRLAQSATLKEPQRQLGQKMFALISIANSLFTALLIVAGRPTSATAQIQPAAGDTNTIVTPNGSTFDITGGQKAGVNLFHGFEKFGISNGQTANFVSQPEVQNILGRVTGGDASIVNGLIKVTGGNANLYLINPAGIFFGANARLDVPGAFTATTASGIGIGSQWFKAIGANDYASLAANPSGFAFTGQSGAIVNAGNLAVGSGQNLTLLGGTVISTGTINAPGGKITIAAVQGDKSVRISEEGHLLSLELPLEAKAAISPQAFTPLSLSQLLTAGDPSQSTGITVEDGVIKLTNLGATIPNTAGTTVVSNQVNVSGATGGTVHVLGDKVGLVGANINASGTQGGGTVLVGGDYKGQGTVPNASQTYVSPDSVIRADALQTGNGGRAIVWADDTTRFDGRISARGGVQSGDGGFVEVSGKNTLHFQGNVDTSASKGSLGTILLDPRDITIINGSSSPAGVDAALADGVIALGDFPGNSIFISPTVLGNLAGNISLQASRDITILDDLTFQLGTVAQTVSFSAGRDINLFGTLQTQGRSLILSAVGETVIRSSSDGIFSNGGNITINSPLRANAITANINAGSGVTAGQVQINGAITDASNMNLSGSNLQVGAIRVAGDLNFNGSTTLTGGEIASTSGNITFNNPVTLTANTTVTTSFFPGGGPGTGSITFDAPIDGSFGLTVIGDRSTSFNAPVGSTTPLASFKASANFAPLTLGGSVSTNGGDLQLSGGSNQGITLNQNVTLNTGAGGNIEIGQINSDATPRNLTLQAGLGNIRTNALGATRALNNLLINGNDIQVGNANTLGNLILNARNNIQIDGRQIRAGGNLQLLTNNTLALADAAGAANPLVLQSAGNTRLQGVQGIDLEAINNPSSKIESGGNLSLVSDGSIVANARLISGGKFSAQTTADTPASFRSDLQTLISSTQDVTFGDYTGLALKVESLGSITAGNITTTGANATLSGTDPDLSVLAAGSAVILRAGVPPLANAPQILPTVGGTTFVASGQTTAPATITVGNINTSSRTGGAIILSSPGNIQTGNLRTGGDLSSSSSSPRVPGSVDLRSNGNISVRTINTSGSDGGDVTINAGGTFRAIGTFLAGDFVDGSTNANSVAGRAALGARLLMSINATGVSSGGAKVQIRQGGTAFQVGPNFVVDNSGAVIYREFTTAADGAIVLGDRVMPAPRANGSINFGSFVRANGDVVNRFNVIAVSEPLNITDPTVSFTAGAITSNQENAGLVVSVRDRLFVTDLAVGGRIGITFEPPPPPVPPVVPPIVPPVVVPPVVVPPVVPPVIPDSQTVQRQINNQTSGSGCNQATTIASSTSEKRSFNNTRDPCAVTNDEAQILKILGESPNLDQDKFLNLKKSQQRTADPITKN